MPNLSGAIKPPKPNDPKASRVKVGSGSGILGAGYAYVTKPNTRNASGNYGGGYAYVSGRRPGGAKRRG